MNEEEQVAVIRGTRDGITLVINELPSFQEVLLDLKTKFSEEKAISSDQNVDVTVQLGNRYLTDDEKEQVSKIVSKKNHFVIKAFESNVVLREEAISWQEESEIKSMNKVVRSGQVLEVTGDLLLIGDVNPGGKVIATGNIYIMGNLRGIAHAGSSGDQDAVIVASYMEPSQLRIAHYISRSPDYETTGVYMECGFLDDETKKIVIDRLQVLTHKRKDLSGFERRILNG